MHLDEAREPGRKNGADEDIACIHYILDHAKELFELEKIGDELIELLEEVETAGIATPWTGLSGGGSPG